MGSSGRHGAYVADVYGFLAYRLGSRTLAEELTRATFERARLERWVPDSGSVHSRVALLRIARRVSDTQMGVGARPEADLAVGVALTEALAGLVARERTVLALRFGSGLAAPEMAAVLGHDEARVRARLSRALRRVRVALAERDQRDQEQQQDART